MNFTLAGILGGLAMVLSIVSFAPQAWMIIRTRDTSSISLGTYTITVAGFCVWVAYGIANGDWPIIAANTICGCLAAFILTMKILPQSSKEKVAAAVEPDKNSG